MNPEILVFLITGVFSGLVGLYGFKFAFTMARDSIRIFFGAMIASLYFVWLAIIYLSVVLGINSPTNYSGWVRPLFNGLLIGIFLVFTGVVNYRRGRK